jgi:thioredoxin reductase
MFAEKEYDIIIIGAGPAGLFAAISTNQASHTLVLEKNDSLSKNF